MRNFLHYAIVPGALLLPWLLAIPFLIPLPPLFFWVVLPFVALGAILFLSLIRCMPVAFAVIVVLGLWLVPLFILFPLLIVPALLAVVVFLWVLRHYEKSEPEIIHRPEVDQILELAALEDYDVTNQYTALGSVKPNRFRRGLFPVIHVADRLLRAARLSARPSRAHPQHPFRPLGLPRRQEADDLRQQL